jgi:hypothetical protein
LTLFSEWYLIDERFPVGLETKLKLLFRRILDCKNEHIHINMFYTTDCVTNLRKQSLYDYRHYLHPMKTRNLNTFLTRTMLPYVLTQKNSIFQVSYAVYFGITLIPTIVLAKICLHFQFFLPLQQSATFKPLCYSLSCTLPLQSTLSSQIYIFFISHCRSL